METKKIEQPLMSKKKKQEQKQKEFREFLSQNNVVLAIVKFLLSIKNAKEPVENPVKALKDYFGDYKDPSWDQFEEQKKNYEILERENTDLQQQIQDLNLKIQLRKEQIIQEEEEERLRQEEELNKKNTKKGPKK